MQLQGKSNVNSWLVPTLPGACRDTSALLNFDGQLGYKVLWPKLGTDFRITAFLKFTRPSGSGQGTGCRDPILSRVLPTTGAKEFRLCRLDTNQIQFVMEDSQGSPLIALVTAGPVPAQNYIDIKVQVSGNQAMLTVQGAGSVSGVLSGQRVAAETYPLLVGETPAATYLQAHILELTIDGASVGDKFDDLCTNNQCSVFGGCSADPNNQGQVDETRTRCAYAQLFVPTYVCVCDCVSSDLV